MQLTAWYCDILQHVITGVRLYCAMRTFLWQEFLVVLCSLKIACGWCHCCGQNWDNSTQTPSLRLKPSCAPYPTHKSQRHPPHQRDTPGEDCWLSYRTRKGFAWQEAVITGALPEVFLLVLPSDGWWVLPANLHVYLPIWRAAGLHCFPMSEIILFNSQLCNEKKKELYNYNYDL